VCYNLQLHTPICYPAAVSVLAGVLDLLSCLVFGLFDVDAF
jgi:hypothetical protein